MLLAEFLAKAGDAGAVVLLKIDGERLRRRWTVVLSSPHVDVGSRGDFERLDQGLQFAREWLVRLPGDTSWVHEPVEDVDGLI